MWTSAIWHKKALTVFVIVILVVLCLYCTITITENVPFYRDANAVPHGTGIEEGHYSDGGIRTRTYFKHGKYLKMEWYDRDGKLMQNTIFDEHERGIGIALNDFGKVRIRGTLKRGLFDGSAERYDEKGLLTEKVLYKNGIIIQKIATTNSSPTTLQQ